MEISNGVEGKNKGLRCRLGIHKNREFIYDLSDGRSFHGAKPEKKTDVGIEHKCIRCGEGYFYFQSSTFSINKGGK